jgi:hypothetical protein
MNTTIQMALNPRKGGKMSTPEVVLSVFLLMEH